MVGSVVDWFEPDRRQIGSNLGLPAGMVNTSWPDSAKRESGERFLCLDIIRASWSDPLPGIGPRGLACDDLGSTSGNLTQLRVHSDSGKFLGRTEADWGSIGRNDLVSWSGSGFGPKALAARPRPGARSRHRIYLRVSRIPHDGIRVGAGKLFFLRSTSGKTDSPERPILKPEPTWSFVRSSW